MSPEAALLIEDAPPGVPAQGDGREDAPARPRRGRRRRRFTPTEEALLGYLASETVLHGGARCTKRELAERIGRNVKTIDRSLADLRRRGPVSVEMRFNESGGQIASEYRVVMDAGT